MTRVAPLTSLYWPPLCNGNAGHSLKQVASTNKITKFWSYCTSLVSVPVKLLFIEFWLCSYSYAKISIFLRKRNVALQKNTGVVLHIHSVPKVAIAERLDCILTFLRKLDSLLKPDKKRANVLKDEFAKGFNGIVERIWPHVNLVLACSTGILNY